jgi:hypothetical protein
MIPIRFITSPFRWLRTTYAVIHESRTHKERVLSVRDLTVRELRQNGAYVELYEKGEWSPQNVAQALEFGKWDGHATEWSALRRHNLALWNEVADAYTKLRATARSAGAPTVTSEELRELADRLSEATP